MKPQRNPKEVCCAVPGEDNLPNRGLQCSAMPSVTCVSAGCLQTTNITLSEMDLWQPDMQELQAQLSNFLCLAYCCRIAVQAPFPSPRSSAAPQAQWLLLTPARAVWIMPALRGDSSFSCPCLKACSKSAYFSSHTVSKPENFQLPLLWLVRFISKFKRHECLLVGWICNLQMTG